jgi:hypothetical protein
MGLFKGPSATYDNENFAQMLRKQMCIGDNVKGIINSNINAKEIIFCEKIDENAYDVGWDYTKGTWASTWFAEFNLTDKNLCCPAKYSYFRDRGIGNTDTCCPPEVVSYNKVGGDSQLSCGTDSYGQNIPGKAAIGKSVQLGEYPTGNFRFNEPTIYSCAADYCYLVGEKLTNIGKVNETEDKNGKQCIDFYGQDTEGKYCIDGAFVTEEYYLDFMKIGPGAMIACNDFVDANEKTNCLNCYKNCTTNDCSYSSLGCIQTTQPGIITRVFQIGLGVVGAIAIARLIQAALLRQTADPSKIQESYDIITSVVIGIVVLLGSMVILNFVGQDILQMIPF